MIAPQRARAAVQAVVGRIVDAPDDERFQRINAESRTFRETGLEEGRALLAETDLHPAETMDEAVQKAIELAG